MRSIISTIPINLEGFLPSILLLVVMVVIVAIVGVVIVVVIIGVVVVVMIIGIVVVVRIIGDVVVVGWAYAFHQDKASLVRVPVANVTLSSSAHLLRENTDSFRFFGYRISLWSGVPIGIVGICHGSSLCFQGGIDLIGDEDPIDEDGDIGNSDSTGVLVSLGGEIFLGGKKSRESNIRWRYNSW
ncbi:hypothetical protein Tco_0519152 [Tanacetum coccineum]